MNKRYVVVTTKHRGVFFGALDEEASNGSLAVLTECQMAVYWSADCHGIGGLMSKGPTEGCKIGPPVPRWSLRDVTSIADCTDEAVKAWKSEPWS